MSKINRDEAEELYVRSIMEKSANLEFFVWKYVRTLDNDDLSYYLQEDCNLDYVVVYEE